MKNILLFGTITLVLSCSQIEIGAGTEPEYTSTVTGYVLERGTNKPLEGLDLDIYCIQGSYTNAHGGYSVSTDSTGRYVVVFSGPSQGLLKINFPGTTSHGSASTDYFHPLSQKRADMISAPYGWIRYHLKNVNLWDGNDRITIRIGGTYNSYYGLVDQVVLSKEHGNTMKKIIWGVERNGITSIFQDSIFLPGFDTVNFQIFY